MTNIFKIIADTRIERLALQRKADELEQLEKDLMYKVQQDFIAAGHVDYMIDGYRAVMKVKQVPLVADWTLILNWIREHNGLDMLQKRLTESAVKLRWDAGIDVPGVAKTPKYVITITKDE